MQKAKAITTFLGTEQDVIDYVDELTSLTSCEFSYEKREDSWLVIGYVDQQAIDRCNMHTDFVIDLPTNLEVYENGETESIEFSRKVHSLSFYHHVVVYDGNVYELEVSDDGVENPEQPARFKQTHS